MVEGFRFEQLEENMSLEKQRTLGEERRSLILNLMSLQCLSGGQVALLGRQLVIGVPWGGLE